MTRLDFWCGFVAIAMAGLIGIAPIFVARWMDGPRDVRRLPVEWTAPAVPVERRA